MSIDSFKSLLPEMLGPVLQASLVSLRLSLGEFYSGCTDGPGTAEQSTFDLLLKGEPSVNYLQEKLTVYLFIYFFK
jgi:hypothetical protein